MRIINGRWVDQYDNPVNNFNVSELLDISDQIKTVYGKDITYERIDLIGSLKSLNKNQEKIIANLLQDHDFINKLAGL